MWISQTAKFSLPMGAVAESVHFGGLEERVIPVLSTDSVHAILFSKGIETQFYLPKDGERYRFPFGYVRMGEDFFDAASRIVLERGLGGVSEEGLAQCISHYSPKKSNSKGGREYIVAFQVEKLLAPSTTLKILDYRGVLNEKSQDLPEYLKLAFEIVTHKAGLWPTHRPKNNYLIG